jgi:hypothetical protein
VNVGRAGRSSPLAATVPPRARSEAMAHRTLTRLLALALTLAAASLAARANLPGNHQGYEPEQPIAFSHRLHAGELQIACLYCHAGAERSRYAGIPAASVCMNCHRYFTASARALAAEDAAAEREGRAPRPVVSPELRKLYDALGLGDTLRRDPARRPRPIAWVRVHSLPDFVYFDHRAHLAAGLGCRPCHGPVETMDRVRQVADLSMGWCVNCHRAAAREGIAGRAVRASTDCATCHY